MVPGSLLCQKCHGRITQPGLAAERNERPIWPLQKVWPVGQRLQVTYDDMPTRCITGRDVGGGHDDEVHGFGRLVPGETPKEDPMPGVWS